MRIIIIILIAFTVISCSKNKTNPEPDIYNGFGSAKINGEVFDFKPIMKFHTSKGAYGLVLDHFLGDIMKAQIHFHLFSSDNTIQTLFRENEFYLYPQAIYSTRIGDGDVAGTYYILNETDEIEDFLQLISFNEITGEVKGRFQTSFVVDTAQIFDPSSPDTIVITEGYFETTVFE